MKLFEDILITSDYDYTLTDREGKIPQRNIEAIRYFMENGGAFTVNTGRSYISANDVTPFVPTNAPIIGFNGAAMWENGEYKIVHEIKIDPWSILSRLAERFPEVKLEIHGLDRHYIINAIPEDIEVYEKRNWPYQIVQPGDDVGTFVKFNVQPLRKPVDPNSGEVRKDKDPAYYDEIRAFIEAQWPEVVVFRSGRCLLSIHDKAVSKLNAARELQKLLGKKILICMGDAGNDLAMLDGADYAYCPADGAVADRYENVCSCGEGAVADVIYKKIPEILANQP